MAGCDRGSRLGWFLLNRTNRHMRQPLSSIDRPVGMRLRADLLVSPVESSGVTTWIVKDPLALEHFQFSAEEYSVMEWLREPISIAELQRRVNQGGFPPADSARGGLGGFWAAATS